MKKKLKVVCLALLLCLTNVLGVYAMEQKDSDILHNHSIYCDSEYIEDNEPIEPASIDPLCWILGHTYDGIGWYSVGSSWTETASSDSTCYWLKWQEAENCDRCGGSPRTKTSSSPVAHVKISEYIGYIDGAPTYNIKCSVCGRLFYGLVR